MKNISDAYALIINLAEAAKHHKRYCNTSDCGVSLYLLRQAAILIHEKVIPIKEWSEVKDFINKEFPLV